ncbi:PTS sugar transporter subunit IIB [Virgibacillus halodenitrificans]|jgi:cellobiose PTS system EIIB component|uniref:PTS sugar transporter subunit IIB n=1 Tax=Virgibacillus halodenitrificans TaxID=1482 RepID=A0AAC9NMH8_VIRHA|nr:PTS sugar transporter subunit IIB [Virgibacillus halodenitrificans]APC49704.1 PTS sugar transporter subunit IIB [Virgibacillus halodenitrificans]MBD1221434.1 PTS sugar transporter subunit IIB [Virgibacillus halodenitrificans]MCG1028170.1 PTS sugar transporter subunit IIB [Virgibacillus halodenitrificans]MCJ0929598.1 PTS sugar transporter subunit IIB [Virgibacillus halodenitrificans]MYL45408.1 PTS sugar transporter subunit IIB [Virgibacillus halodenitrificans]
MKIILVCSAGMSTSMLVNKMRKAAEDRGMDAEINAIAESQLKNNLEGLDVVLVGPQVRYLEKKIKQQLEPQGIKVAIIDQIAYGMMQGDKVLDQAIELKG